MGKGKNRARKISIPVLERYFVQPPRKAPHWPTETRISGLNTIQGWVASPYLSSSLPFCVRFNVALQLVPYNNAATLDTEPPAKSYSGGSLTHLSLNHFQNARPSLGSSVLGLRIKHYFADLLLASTSFGETLSPRNRLLFAGNINN